MNDFCFENVRMICGENREFLAGLPDKSFDLAIDDPPYGIHDKLYRSSRGCLNNRVINMYNNNQWDKDAPNAAYFDLLMQKTENQIIWGGNYFPLPPTRGIICWDKLQPWPNFSAWEMAWTSFDCVARIFKFDNRTTDKQHPTQKPVALYSWLLQNYATPGQTILDPHGGSFSSAIAAYRMGVSYVGIEKDPDYFAAAVERFKKEALQMRLFAVPTSPPPKQPALLGI